jgi:alkylated DNA repair dioxygenase AlkB
MSGETQDDWFGGLASPEVDWYPDWLAPERAAVLREALVREVQWRQEAMRTPRGLIPLPRLTAWQGDPDAVYVYSGIRNIPSPWTLAVQALRELAEQTCATRFNSVLLNRYRDGRDAMGWHSDDEPELGAAPVIASVSLGVARSFEFKHRASGVVQRYRLTDGSLLVMQGQTQHDWLHRIPKAAGLAGERINLTFRLIHAR